MTSQRAVAKRFKIDPASLNRFIKGKENLSKPWTESGEALQGIFKMKADKLRKLSPEERVNRFNKIYGDKN